ncbi:MAG TPA: MXAN_5187 C-terminal domain-containing protein [Thermoanaerobaculia bacterium]|nr:MXAN_5187 C-terminal domain-containing protein [Thermoanaerobaculia bacterium]
MIKQDDELDKLEEDIRILKNKYDQFFSGIAKMPPHIERHAVERFIHELNKQKIRDNGRRFRLNTLVSRYNQFREMWARRIREREEGPLDFRRRQALLEGPAPRVEPPRASVTSVQADPYVKMSPGTNGEEIRRLHQEIERANAAMGKINSVSVEQLAAMVQKQTELVRSKYNVNTVAFRVETVDGKVKLKAKPLQD